MHIRNLLVSNFKALRHVELRDLRDLVVVAGPNGSGKSTLLDAIRLVRSTYGSERNQHYAEWLQEHGRSMQDVESLHSVIASDSTRPVTIAVDIELTEADRRLVNRNLHALAWSFVLSEASGSYPQPIEFQRLHIARDPAAFEAASLRHAHLVSIAEQELENSNLHLGVEINREGVGLRIKESTLADLLFQPAHSANLPLFKFQSANRAFGAQEMGDLSFNIAQTREERLRQSLYGWADQNRRIKSNLAIDWIHDRLSSPTSEQPRSHLDLHALFAQFIPGKHFRGLQLDAEGRVIFAVELEDGTVHDLDELSSGEKEVIYGYLDLRGNTPDGSLVLFDEPELHLNPLLLSGAVAFYHEGLVKAQGCQVWLVTHSDAILRQAYDDAEYSVVHMSRSDALRGENQASMVGDDRDVESAIAALVGELPAFQPRLRTVILEGSGDDPIDVRLLQALYPDFCARVNLISGGSKAAVTSLRDALGGLSGDHPFAGQFFSITDLDDDTSSSASSEKVYRWDVYHIENYLLDFEAIDHARSVLVGPKVKGAGVTFVEAALRSVGEGIIGDLVKHRVIKEMRLSILKEINLGAAPHKDQLTPSLIASAKSTFARLASMSHAWPDEKITSTVEDVRVELAQSFESDKWLRTVPGREILKAFVQQHVPGVSYEAFRNLVIENMRSREVKPAGMSTVVEAIEAEIRGNVETG